MSGFLLLVTVRALLMSPKGRNASRDNLVKIGWVVYSLLFPCIFSPNKLLMPFFALMLRYMKFCFDCYLQYLFYWQIIRMNLYLTGELINSYVALSNKIIFPCTNVSLQTRQLVTLEIARFHLHDVIGKTLCFIMTEQRAFAQRSGSDYA